MSREAIIDFFRSANGRVALVVLFCLVPMFVIRNLPSQKRSVLDISLLGSALAGNVKDAREVLARGADANYRHPNTDETVLMTAARGDARMQQPGQLVVDHGEVLKLLLKHGAEVNARDPSGMTALMVAARAGRDDLVQILLDAGADVTAKDIFDRTALDWAERSGHEKVATRLRGAAGK